ncbi:MAG: hypothetical protein ACUVSU_13365, partial [Aggregatilineaceae bacterium]
MFSQPQFKYLVTVLLALMLCQETHTLTGLLRQIADRQSVSRLSRFLSQSPWSAADVSGAWIERFHEQMAEQVEAEHERQRRQRPKRQGRPQKTVVTGYLIGDDSTQHNLITSGLKANRWLWVTDAQGQGRWMRLDEYAAHLKPEQYQKMTWPDQGEPHTVYRKIGAKAPSFSCGDEA